MKKSTLVALSFASLAVILGWKLGEIIRLDTSFFARKSRYLVFMGWLFLLIFFVRQKRWSVSAFLALINVFSFLYYRPLTEWMMNVGSDALAEMKSYSFSEALFILESVAFLTPEWSLEKLVKHALIALVFYLTIEFGIRKCQSWRIELEKFALAAVAVLFLAIPISMVFGRTSSLFDDATEHYRNLSANFSESAFVQDFTRKGLKLLVYIGESTTSMHMGIYQYPINTSPHLSKLHKMNELLVFRKVFSTHTHTSPSLLEALSLKVGSDNEFSVIEKRMRVILPRLLQENGVKTYYVSNQGQSGSWNSASSVIFGNTESRHSVVSKHMGNLEYMLERPYDHDLFASNIPDILNLTEEDSAVVFFHSYAGHGNYEQWIPKKFHLGLDGYLSSEDPEAVVGSKGSSLEHVNEYDNAIRYIDFSLHSAIQLVSDHSEPVVFIYFSDHGESPFSGLGHDSSRFVHEMVRVPFLIYFNRAARTAYPELFQRYLGLSETDAVSTLAQLPYTIIDLLGGGSMEESRQLNLIGEFREPHEMSPILVRQISNGISYVALGPIGSPVPDENLVDATDRATQVFVASEEYDGICYHGANTLGTAIRGAMVADCLEFDLVVEDGFFSVYHPPQESVNLEMTKIIDIARSGGLGVWIDGKNLDVAANCDLFLERMDSLPPLREQILVEFPSATEVDASVLRCTNGLHDLGIKTSYYVPTHLAVSCSEALSGNVDCEELRDRLYTAYQSGAFTDYSFDIRGYAAMKSIPFAGELSWNAWGVDLDMLRSMGSANQFEMIIMNTSDPNGR